MARKRDEQIRRDQPSSQDQCKEFRVSFIILAEEKSIFRRRKRQEARLNSALLQPSKKRFDYMESPSVIRSSELHQAWQKGDRAQAASWCRCIPQFLHREQSGADQVLAVASWRQTLPPMPLFLTVLAIITGHCKASDGLMGPVVSLLLERLSLRCMFPR